MLQLIFIAASFAAIWQAWKISDTAGVLTICMTGLAYGAFL